MASSTRANDRITTATAVGRVRRGAAVLFALGAVMASLSPQAGAAAAPTTPTTPTGSPASAVTFGATLDWRSDSAQKYAERLGGTAGLYGETLSYPLRAVDKNNLETAARAAAAQNADLLVHLIPSKPLRELTTGDASDLADRLDTFSTRIRVRFEVDFAPDMNASWTTWGQQPSAFVAAYRVVADAVHRQASESSMVWAPANGAGYPYGASRGDVSPSGTRTTNELDTNGDGKVTSQDDPYRPYWPGSAAVDRVALPVYWYGPGSDLGVNALPTPAWLQRSLQGTAGYATATGPDRAFVQTYAVAQDKPMLLETSAVYVPSQRSGPTHAAIAQAWITQVFAPSLLTQFPAIDQIAWLEQRGPDAEARGAEVDWRATDDAQTAAALRAALKADGLRLGPVPKAGGRTQADSSVQQADQIVSANGASDAGSDRILIGLASLLGLLVIAGIAGRVRPAWGYPQKDLTAGRDQRVDVVRGFVMVLVILTHIEVAGIGWWAAQRLGAITGAEMFVLLSGVVLGALYPSMVKRFGEFAAASAAIRRAAVMYLKTIGIMLAVFFLSLISFVNTRSITTFTDRGTGEGGEAAAGRVYDLLGTSHHLLDYPPPEYAVRDLALLRWGPWPMNIMGLFVVLSLVVPALMWLVRRRMWWVVLAGSWAFYVLNRIHPVTVFQAQFEPVFPLLSWQVVFTHGLVLGRYRVAVYRFLVSRTGKAVMVAVPAVLIVGLLLLRGGVDLPGLPAYSAIYNTYYQRTFLDPGRLIDLPIFLFSVYALLTTCWRPLNRAVGRFLEPIGRNSLRVFFIQVFLVLGVGVLPGLDRGSDWQGTVVDVVAVAIAWLLVRDWTRRPKRSVTETPRVPERETASSRA